MTVQVQTTMSGAHWFSPDGGHWYALPEAAQLAAETDSADDAMYGTGEPEWASLPCPDSLCPYLALDADDLAEHAELNHAG